MKYWYQDGWAVLGIVCALGFFGYQFHASNEKAKFNATQVFPKVDLQFRQPLFGPPTLDCKVWHEQPETLRNMVVFASVSTDPKADNSWDTEKSVCENWSPNRDHQVSFSFPLKKSHLEHRVYVQIGIGGKHNKFVLRRLKWADGHWHDWPEGK
jgi:hypothetical protein